MSLQTIIVTGLKASVALIVFAIGLRANARDATYLIRKPAQLLRAIFSMNILMPLFTVSLVYMVDLTPAVKIALVMLSVSPVPPLLPNKMVKSGGTNSYAVGLLVAESLLAIVFVPLAMEIIELVLNIPLKMTVASVAPLVLMTALLPLSLGMVVNRLAPVVSERIAKPISLIATLALVAGAAAILIAVAPAVWMLLGNGTLIAIFAFVLVGLTIGYFLGGPVPENRISLAIATSSRHPGMALALAIANFPEEKLAMAAVLLYMVVNAIVSVPYYKWMQRRNPDVEIPVNA
jgi:bile acid:Na+ symporter, BASS family